MGAEIYHVAPARQWKFAGDCARPRAAFRQPWTTGASVVNTRVGHRRSACANGIDRRRDPLVRVDTTVAQGLPWIIGDVTIIFTRATTAVARVTSVVARGTVVAPRGSVAVTRASIVGAGAIMVAARASVVAAGAAVVVTGASTAEPTGATVPTTAGFAEAGRETRGMAAAVGRHAEGEAGVIKAMVAKGRDHATRTPWRMITMRVNIHCGHHASEVSIRKLKADIGRTIPGDYLAFVMDHDGAKFSSNILHLPGGNSINVRELIPVEEVMNCHKHIDAVDCDFIPVASDTCGNYVCIDLSSWGRVFFWDHEIPGDSMTIADCFSTFLDKLTPFDVSTIDTRGVVKHGAWIDPEFLKSQQG